VQAKSQRLPTRVARWFRQKYATHLIKIFVPEDASRMTASKGQFCRLSCACEEEIFRARAHLHAARIRTKSIQHIDWLSRHFTSNTASAENCASARRRTHAHVDLLVQHATRMRHVLSSFVASLAPPHFLTLCHKRFSENVY
jgi:hypothetical protein